MNKKTYPLQVKEIIDPKTKARVRVYVAEQGDDQVFYYHGYSITADNRFLIFWSSVSGSYQIHAIDLTASKPESIQLTEAATFNSDQPTVDRIRNVVYYAQGNQIMMLNLGTGDSDWIFEKPKECEFTSFASDGKQLLFSYYEPIPHPRIKPKASQTKFSMRNALYGHPRSFIFAIDVETLNADHVYGEMAYLGHVHPIFGHPDFCCYANQSLPRRQQELHVVPIAFTEAKTPLQLFTGMGLNYVGHSWSTEDGWVACQMCEYLNVDRWNRYTDTVMYNAIGRLDGTGVRRARFIGENKPLHCHAARADSWWVGDTMPLPGNDMDFSTMVLMKNHWESQEMTMQPLFQHNHDHKRPFHVHPCITRDETKVIFSAKAFGRNCVQILDLQGFLADQRLEMRD
ncbi:MAG: hypothetical protein HY360_16085 [Verrucomicrobia bacterium]|nr:hypothetical protein [Verrucomicrobiota bacterium]